VYAKDDYAQNYHHKKIITILFVMGSKLEKNAPNGYTVCVSVIEHMFLKFME
jgi:hypothetical protein